MALRLPRYAFGAPLHPLLVHFPVVLWLTLPVLDALALARGAAPWWDLARAVNAAGVGIGLLAIATGFMDYLRLSETGSSDVRLAARHGIRTTAAWLMLAGKLIVTALVAVTQTVLVMSLAIDVIACGLLVQAVVFGTRLVYRARE